jgi:NAD+ kinase
MPAAPRVVVLMKRTSFQKLVEEEHDERVERLLAAGDITVRRLQSSHDDHLETIEEVRRALTKLGAKSVFLDGPRTPIPGTFDLVVTVGGDGTLLSASHQVRSDVPLLGVNSAPDHSVGFFCGARKGEARAALESALSGKTPRTLLTRMRVELNDRCLHARVLNEALFCAASPAATSRYILRIHRSGGTEEEEQRSSGMWIGPAAGSTAAQRSAGGRILPITSKEIQFVVREPYTPVGVPLHLALGTIDEGGWIEIRNKMSEAKIFLDGPHIVFDAAIGDIVRMKRSEETLTVLGLTRNGRKKSPALSAGANRSPAPSARRK